MNRKRHIPLSAKKRVQLMRHIAKQLDIPSFVNIPKTLIINFQGQKGIAPDGWIVVMDEYTKKQTLM